MCIDRVHVKKRDSLLLLRSCEELWHVIRTKVNYMRKIEIRRMLCPLQMSSVYVHWSGLARRKRESILLSASPVLVDGFNRF